MSSFSSGRFAVHKNTTDNKLKKKTFSLLKNSIHVEPAWFSLDNLILCAALTTAQWYCTRSLKLFSYERDEFFFIVFLKYRLGQAVNKQKSSDKLEITCGTKFCGF